MLFRKICPFCKEEKSQEIDVKPIDIVNWHNGALIQDAMPQVPASQRDFLLMGICLECWDALYGVDDD